MILSFFVAKKIRWKVHEFRGKIVLVDPWRGVSWFILWPMIFLRHFLDKFWFVWNLKRFVAPLGSWLYFCLEKRKKFQIWKLDQPHELWSDTCAKLLKWFSKNKCFKKDLVTRKKTKKNLSDNQCGSKKTSLYSSGLIFLFRLFTHTLCNRMRFHSRYCHTSSAIRVQSKVENFILFFLNSQLETEPLFC